MACRAAKRQLQAQAQAALSMRDGASCGSDMLRRLCSAKCVAPPHCRAAPLQGSLQPPPAPRVGYGSGRGGGGRGGGGVHLGGGLGAAEVLPAASRMAVASRVGRYCSITACMRAAWPSEKKFMQLSSL